FRMSYCTSVLVHDENDWKSGVQKFSLTLRSWLLNGIEDFLKRHNRHDCGYDLLIGCAAEYRFGNGQRHLLSGANHLRATNYQSTIIHVCHDLTHARIDFFQLDHVRLKSAMQGAVDWPESEGNEVWIFLKCFL